MVLAIVFWVTLPHFPELLKYVYWIIIGGLMPLYWTSIPRYFMTRGFNKNPPPSSGNSRLVHFMVMSTILPLFSYVFTVLSMYDTSGNEGNFRFTLDAEKTPFVVRFEGR